MFHNRIRSVAFALAVCLAASATAVAQMKTMRADIPFDFTIRGDETLSSGTYYFRQGASSNVVQIEGDGSNRAIVLVRTGQDVDREESVVVFNRYGSQYFLSGIRSAFLDVTFPKSKAEKELQQRASVKRQPVYVALSRP